MDARALPDTELEALLRRRAADDFDADLVVDQAPDGSWRARCMEREDSGLGVGPANLFSTEGAQTRRAALEGLAANFAVKDEHEEWKRRGER